MKKKEKFLNEFYTFITIIIILKLLNLLFTYAVETKGFFIEIYHVSLFGIVAFLIYKSRE